MSCLRVMLRIVLQNSQNLLSLLVAVGVGRLILGSLSSGEVQSDVTEGSLFVLRDYWAYERPTHEYEC